MLGIMQFRRSFIVVSLFIALLSFTQNAWAPVPEVFPTSENQVNIEMLLGSLDEHRSLIEGTQTRFVNALGTSELFSGQVIQFQYVDADWRQTERGYYETMSDDRWTLMEGYFIGLIEENYYILTKEGLWVFKVLDKNHDTDPTLFAAEVVVFGNHGVFVTHSMAEGLDIYLTGNAQNPLASFERAHKTVVLRRVRTSPFLGSSTIHAIQRELVFNMLLERMSREFFIYRTAIREGGLAEPARWYQGMPIDEVTRQTLVQATLLSDSASAINLFSNTLLDMRLHPGGSLSSQPGPQFVQLPERFAYPGCAGYVLGRQGTKIPPLEVELSRPGDMLFSPVNQAAIQNILRDPRRRPILYGLLQKTIPATRYASFPQQVLPGQTQEGLYFRQSEWIERYASEASLYFRASVHGLDRLAL